MIRCLFVDSYESLGLSVFARTELVPRSEEGRRCRHRCLFQSQHTITVDAVRYLQWTWGQYRQPFVRVQRGLWVVGDRSRGVCSLTHSTCRIPKFKSQPTLNLAQI